MSYRLERDKLFDDIMYVYRAEITDLTSTTKTEEIDLDLPRGYVAKVHKTLMRVYNIADTNNYLVNMALVNDPDDETTVAIPENTVKHDVISDHRVNAQRTDANGVFAVSPSLEQFIDYKPLDVIAARNMRLNAKDDQNNGDGDCECIIWYTIEKIKGSENLLNLLDIL